MRTGIVIWSIILIISCLAVVNGWVPVLNIIGCQVVEDESIESANDIYISECNILLESWAQAVNEYEETPSTYSANNAKIGMDEIISKWDLIMPPDEYYEYHLYILKAMEYDREVYGIMSSTEQEDVSEIKILVTELCILKDEMLLKAEECLNKQ